MNSLYLSLSRSLLSRSLLSLSLSPPLHTSHLLTSHSNPTCPQHGNLILNLAAANNRLDLVQVIVKHNPSMVHESGEVGCLFCLHGFLFLPYLSPLSLPPLHPTPPPSLPFPLFCLLYCLFIHALFSSSHHRMVPFHSTLLRSVGMKKWCVV